MGNPTRSSQYVSFGEFELDLRTRELSVNGSKFDLQEQPFQILSMLLERPGELVTRDELTKRLWPADTYVDFEHSLNRVIKRLREALDDSAEQPRFIETLPRRGYRFIGSLQRDKRIGNGGAAISVDDRPREEISSRSWPRRSAFVLVVLGLGCVAGLLTFWLLSPAAVLKVVRTRKVTTSNKVDPWGLTVSDGSRIYFLEREGDHWNLLQTSVSGGEAQNVTTPFRSTRVLAISQDRASFLIGSFVQREERMPLWIWPAQGGAPKRLGKVIAYDGAWCPNDRQIVYSEDDGIYQIDVDGANAHRIVSTDGRAGMFAWSPDGHFLRFTLSTLQPVSSAIWQVDSDGTHLHRLLPAWDHVPEECCGSWSPDGQYFFFSSRHAETLDIWAIRERTGIFPRHLEPIRLTTGPIDFSDPLPGAQGRGLFVLGGNGTFELASYDLSRQQFTPLLPRISASSLSFSRDGTHLAYTSSRDFSLVRLKPDGSEPLVLTQTGLQPTSPTWSPDGKQLLFEGRKPNGIDGIFVTSAEGGTARVLFEEDHKQGEPAWSPDGKLIAFSHFDDSGVSEQASTSIHIFDSKTNQSSLLPGSVGLRSPSWSPDGRYLAAVSEDLHKLMVLDLHARKWSELNQAKLLNGALTWSRDGNDLYYQDLLATAQPIYRIHVRTREREVVTTFETFLKGGIHRAGLLGRAPDGSLITRLDRGNSDIYFLDLEAH
jgi:Tol biopolymer transport system component/DNA-binding winged helix-turn-helix (wHTH) protein